MKLRFSVHGLSILCITLILTAGNCFGFDDTTNSNLEADILAALNARASTAYLQTDGNELQLIEHVAGESMTFQKITNDLEILGNKIIVYLDDNGGILRVKDDSTEDLQTGGDQAEITAAEAIEVMAASLKNLEALKSATRLVWFRDRDLAVLAWQVDTKLAPSDAPVSPTDLYTAVDASTGQILSQHQRDTNVYEPDPKTGTGVFPRRIVINDAVGAAGSQAFALAYPEVCSLFNPGCTGTLIATDVVLAARHCGSGPGDFIDFGPNSNAPIFFTTVSSVTLPDGAGTLLDGGDVEILCLNANVPGGVATPMRLIDETSSIVGMTAATVGYGFNGVGSAGHGFSSDGLRWGGENVIDVYGSPAGNSGSNIFSTDFDDGSAGNNTIPGGSPTPLTNEATTAPGDSGGPLVVNIGGENLIAGVLSGGSTATSVYGDISWWTGTSDFRAQIEAKGGQFVDGPMPPPNDDFANTIFLGGLPAMTTGTNVDATTEDGEQNLGNTSATVWWFFTAPNTGMVTADTFGSDFDTVLTIYEGFFPGAGPGDLVFVAENDQAGGTDQSQITFPVVAGECYEVRVGGFLGDMGNIELNVVEGDPTPPPNDDFANTIFTGGFPFTLTGDNVNATTEAGEQNLVNNGATVWWFFTAPDNGTVTVDTFGSDFDTILTIYEGFFPGAGPGDLIFVTENDQAGGTDQSEVTFPVVGGDCYEIRVGGFLEDEGNIELNGSFTPDGVLLGDCNGDGEINLLDVAPFVEAVSGGGDPCADINQDGAVNLLDVAPFIALLSGG